MAESVQNADVLWNVAEAAQALRVSKSLIYRMVGEGEIPHVRVAGSLRFIPSEVKAWLLSHQVA